MAAGATHELDSLYLGLQDPMRKDIPRFAARQSCHYYMLCATCCFG